MKGVPSQMEPLEEKNLTSHPVDRGWSWLILAGKDKYILAYIIIHAYTRIRYLEQLSYKRISNGQTKRTLCAFIHLNPQAKTVMEVFLSME